MSKISKEAREAARMIHSAANDDADRAKIIQSAIDKATELVVKGSFDASAVMATENLALREQLQEKDAEISMLKEQIRVADVACQYLFNECGSHKGIIDTRQQLTQKDQRITAMTEILDAVRHQNSPGDFGGIALCDYNCPACRWQKMKEGK